MKRFLAIMLVLIMAFSLVACGSESKNEAPVSTPSADSNPATAKPEEPETPVNREVVVGVSADPATWAPWAAFNNGRRDMMPMVYQTLTAVVVDFQAQKSTTYYVLASGYKKIDNNTYEIYIRKGISDTLGNPFTADDAVFSYETAKAQGTLSQLNAIDHLEFVDDYTFRMITGRALAVGDFEDLLTGFNMVTREAYEASPDGMATEPIGTTGYVLSDYVAGSSATFVRADGYWNDAANKSKNVNDGYCALWETDNVDTVQFEIITDRSTMAIALESGQIDISSNVSVKDVELFKEGYNTNSYPENTYGISFNTSDASITNNYNLRMALALCVDSQGILDAVFSGDGIVLKAWAYPTYFDYQKSWESEDYFEYNLELAKEYLEAFYAETGKSASDISLRMLVRNTASEQKAAEAIQGYIVSLIGNSNCCSIESYDNATYEGMWTDKTAFDILIMYAQSSNRSYCTYTWNMYANRNKVKGGSDVWHADSDELQSMIDAAIREETHSDKTVAAFQAYINENAYMKNLICGNVYIVAAGWIGGLENSIGPKSCIQICALDYDWSQSGK